MTLVMASTALKAQAYKDTTLSPYKRSLDLLSRMNTAEKIGQLATLFGWEMYQKHEGSGIIQISDKLKSAIDSGHIGMLWGTLRADPWTQKTLENGLDPKDAITATNKIQHYAITHSRLGIPLLLAEECAHGLMAIGSTVFPTAIGQASTWDPKLIRQMATAIAMETRVLGSHIAYGPILDLARDPRWSRVEETYGEDSYLVSKMGEAFVHGLQGSGAFSQAKDSLHVISTLKHFISYGIPSGGHNGGPAVTSNRMLFDDYLPPFKSAITKAGALSVMTAYNSIDGVPCTANEALLKDLLKKQWGFKGFVVSDLGSISGIYNSSHTAAGPTQAAAAAMQAGVDSDLGGYGYGKYLDSALQKGLISMGDLDSATVRILNLKFALGLFEHPYRSVNGASLVHNKIHQQLNQQVATQSIVLLKKKLLPLSPDIKSIAVIGPNSDNTYNQLGDYTAPQDPASVTTILEGIKALVGKNTTLRYAKGCAIRDSSSAGFTAAIEAAKASEVVVVVLGGSSARDFKTEYKSTGAAIATQNTISDMENGEGNDRSTLKLLGRQSELLAKLAATGKPIILVLINGRPVAFEKEADMAGDILEAWYPGAEGGKAIAQIIFGKVSPSGRLPISIPRSVGQLPVYYSQPKGSGGHYVEGPGQPLYPFGYGLSYGSFEYSDLKVSKTENNQDVLLDVSFKVTNTSKRFASTDIQQLYITDQTSSVVTPIRHLVGFSRCYLKPGQSVTQHIKLDKTALSLWNLKGQQVVEPGNFILALSKFAGDPDALKAQVEVHTGYLLDMQPIEIK